MLFVINLTVIYSSFLSIQSVTIIVLTLCENSENYKLFQNYLTSTMTKSTVESPTCTCSEDGTNGKALPN